PKRIRLLLLPGFPLAVMLRLGLHRALPLLRPEWTVAVRRLHQRRDVRGKPDHPTPAKMLVQRRQRPQQRVTVVDPYRPGDRLRRHGTPIHAPDDAAGVPQPRWPVLLILTSRMPVQPAH